MPHAVISCLHANLAALEAVLADIHHLGIDTITCLGDLVGYGPQPSEVVELVRKRAILTCECSYPSQLAERRGYLAHHWTAAQLSKDNTAFLASLPTSLRRDRFLFVHVIRTASTSTCCLTWMSLRRSSEWRRPEPTPCSAVIPTGPTCGSSATARSRCGCRALNARSA